MKRSLADYINYIKELWASHPDKCQKNEEIIVYLENQLYLSFLYEIFLKGSKQFWKFSDITNDLLLNVFNKMVYDRPACLLI